MQNHNFLAASNFSWKPTVALVHGKLIIAWCYSGGSLLKSYQNPIQFLAALESNHPPHGIVYPGPLSRDNFEQYTQTFGMEVIIDSKKSSLVPVLVRIYAIQSLPY